jgi:GPH family glycoside/pentoside/hexuronide:cation symporter
MAAKANLHRRLPFKVKLGYGFGGFSTIFTLTLTVLYTNPFLVDTVGLAPAFVGIMVAIATVWDGISDPLIGYCSDNRDPAKGRRRPFFLWVAAPYAVAIWLYFTNWGFGTTATQVYFIFVLILYYTVHTLFDVPYTALAGEMSFDYDERTSINTYRRWASDVAGIFAGLFFYVVGYFAASTQDVFRGYSYSAGIFGVLCAVTILVAYKTTKGYELKIDLPQKTFSLRDFFDPLKNKSFLFVMLHFSTALIGQAFINAWVIFYFWFKCWTERPANHFFDSIQFYCQRNSLDRFIRCSG